MRENGSTSRDFSILEIKFLVSVRSGIPTVEFVTGGALGRSNLRNRPARFDGNRRKRLGIGFRAGIIPDERYLEFGR